jgi:hypothetical protein
VAAEATALASSSPVKVVFPDATKLNALAARAKVDETSAKAMRAILSTRDQLVLRAFNEFGALRDFDRILSLLLAKNRNQRRAARFVMQVALFSLDHFARGKGANAIAFEMKRAFQVGVGADAEELVVRLVDVWMNGWSLECKSVKTLRKVFVTGARNAGLKDKAFGELERDLVHLLGPTPETAFLRVHKSLWIFDADRLLGQGATTAAKRAMERQIGQTLIDWAKTNKRLFVGWPDELDNLIRNMIVLL